MKAAVIEGPGRLAVRELPLPVPGPYQALCRLRFGAVCSGTDQHLVAGHQPFISWIRLPAVLGHESIGEVVTADARVRHLRPGDLVTRVGTVATAEVHIAWGGFAEYGIATDWRAMQEDGLPSDAWSHARVQQVLPPGTDPAAATMIITWRETLSFLRRTGLAAGQRLLVIGSGGNGLAFAGHARNLGATATVVGNAARRATAAAIGAVLVDYRDAAACTALEGPFDVVLDAVGDRAGSEPFLGRMAPGGLLAVYGLDRGWDPQPAAAARGLRLHPGGYDEAETHDEVVALMRAGKLDAAHFLGAEFPLERIADAIDAVRGRRCIKALVRLG